MSHALRAPRSSSVAPRRFAWLLWLALLLPVGQVAAMAHALSHTGEVAGRQAEEDKGRFEIACSLCLIAAPIDGGGLRGEAPALPQPAARHEASQVVVNGAWHPPAARAYLSRAPPFPFQR